MPASLVTGTPDGTINQQEELYIDGAPNLFIQDYSASVLNNPDAAGFYYGMSGTATYPIKEVACITDVSFMQGVTANDVRCDTVGVKDTIVRRDYVDIQFSLQTFMPLSIYTNIVNFSAATVSTPTEKVGIGVYNNNQFWHLYAPKVYDDNVGDYLFFWLHKVKFVEPGDLQMRYGEPWIQQFTARAYADTTYPTTQQFGMILRSDASAV